MQGLDAAARDEELKRLAKKREQAATSNTLFGEPLALPTVPAVADDKPTAANAAEE